MLTSITAVAALVLSLASLGWQVYAWRRTGPQIKVEANTVYTFGPLGNTMLLCVSVTNDGRTGATVNTIGFLVPSGRALISWESYMRPVTLPAELSAAGGSVDYWFNPHELGRTCRENGCAAVDLVPYAKIGSRVVKGTWTKVARDAAPGLTAEVARDGND